jgi:uncharacterized membrane protein YeiH
MERSWLWRRWAVFSSLAVCDAVILYLTIFGADTRLNQDLGNGALILIAALVNGYVFGGVLDDKHKDKALIAQSAVDQATPSTSETTIKVEQ